MRLHFNKDTGPKPSKTVLQEASKVATQGSKDHMAVAMTMRPNGATQTEIINLLDRPHRNKIKKLLADKLAKQTVLPDGSRATRVKLILTKK